MAKKPKRKPRKRNPVALALAFHKEFRAKIVQDKRRKLKHPKLTGDSTT